MRTANAEVPAAGDAPVELSAEEQAEFDQHAEADLAAGFNAASGDAPAAAVVKTDDTTTTTTTKVDDAAATAAATNTDTAAAATNIDVAAVVVVDDEWKDVPPAVRKRLEAMEKLPDQIRNLAGHIGGMKSAMKAAEDAAKATTTAGTAAPDAAAIAAASTSGPKWKQLQEDFPEWAEATDERFAAIAAKNSQQVDVEGITKNATTAATTAATGVAQSTKAEAIAEARRLLPVDLAHEGWEETINTAAFGTWLEKQPPEVKALGASDKPKDAIKMLDAYKADERAAVDKTAAAGKTNQRLAGAAPVKRTTASGPPVLDDEDAFVAGFKEVRPG